MTDKPCPCHSGNVFSACCGPVLAGENAATAESLMRSRYTAYVVGKIVHLLGSWHPSTRPNQIDPATFPHWCGLEIISTEEGGSGDDRGTVEFKASFLSENSIRTLHEKSRFVKENGKWFYVDGDIRPTPAKPAKKIGRNDPCHCGSGKKFKKCCGK